MLRSRPRSGHLALGLAAVVAVLIAGAVAVRASSAPDQIVGRVAVAHQDGARPGDARMIPFLQTAKGPVALRLPQGLTAAPGTRVAVREPRISDGAIVGGYLARLGPPTGPSGVATLGPANFTPGPKTTLVLLAHIMGQPSPGSADAVRRAIFTAPNSVNEFIKEETFGQLSLTGRIRSDGDVYGPYDVTAKSQSVCDNISWGTDAAKAFYAQTGMQAEAWNEVIVVFQESYAVCNFSGVGEIGQLNVIGPARHAWINTILTNGVPTTSVVAHELGHNFGVDHAGGFECMSGGVRVSFTEQCAADPNQVVNNQYRDPFDLMGSGANQENAYHKWESGWLPSASVQTITRDGTYLIAPEESSSAALQLLEVPRDPGAPSYWLDFRQPFGTFFDTFAPTDPVVNGVSIRYANSSTMPHPSKSWLIDTTPATDDFSDAALAVGHTYTDALRGVAITTVSVSPQGALVNVTVADGTDTSPPGPPSGLFATLVGGALQIGWDAASDDSGTVQHYRVLRNGAPLADVYADSATDPAPLAGTTATYDVVPVDPAGNVGQDARIAVTVADTTAPSAPVELVASVQGETATLSWSPSLDNVGVASYEVDRDGHPIATDVQGTSIADPGLSLGSHTYTVRGFDAAGNASAFSTPITVVLVGPAAVPAGRKTTRTKTVTSIKLLRVGKHSVLVSWKAQRGAHRYQVLRAGKKPTLLATVKKVRYVDGDAPVGKLQRSRYVVRAVLSSP